MPRNKPRDPNAPKPARDAEPAKPRYGGPPKGASFMGWGGPARGAGGPEFAPGKTDYQQAISALAADPKHMEAKAALRELALKTWVDVAQDGQNESARVSAADKLAARVGLAEETKIRHSNSEGDGDMTVKHQADDALRSAIGLVAKLEADRRRGDSGADSVAHPGEAEATTP